ncbi:chaperonin 10-like protein [Aspergillus multicolor]|uniref:zinc-binding alcohol dehydrogenase family protein n=1 Tax=Aspergillus multicolor TaxID=41759 RepID=UPI003CCD831D
MPHNKAAWLKDAKSPLTIDDAPEPRPGLGEVVVKNHAVAVNPVDWKIQTYDIFVPSYPTILGVDFAGIVETVGEGATRFVKGQRVIGQGSTAVTGNPANAAYHLYSSTFEILVAPIPDSLSYEDAVVLPLALSTASVGLYAKSHQALPFPTLSPKESGKTVLIWGGASSVGATAVQLAAASGVKVVTTASPKNFELVQSLGAAAVLDYTSPSVVDDVVSALRQAAGTFVGAYDAIATTETLELIGKIAEKAGAAPVLVASVAPADNNIQGVDLRPLFAPTIALTTKMSERLYGIISCLRHWNRVNFDVCLLQW